MLHDPVYDCPPDYTNIDKFFMGEHNIAFSIIVTYS